jgi:phenylalanyl-tRNA synthetase beta chain
VVWSLATEAAPLFLQYANVQVGKQPAGVVGQVSPLVARKFDLRDPVFVAEFNLDFLLSRRTRARSMKPLAAFPAVRRDVAMLVADPVSHEQVIASVRQAKPQNLETVELFDVFRGGNMPAGHKSVAYAFTYRNAERTLTEAEVNSAHEKIVGNLKSHLKAEIR